MRRWQRIAQSPFAAIVFGLTLAAAGLPLVSGSFTGVSQAAFLEETNSAVWAAGRNPLALSPPRSATTGAVQVDDNEGNDDVDTSAPGATTPANSAVSSAPQTAAAEVHITLPPAKGPIDPEAGEPTDPPIQLPPYVVPVPIDDPLPPTPGSGNLCGDTGIVPHALGSGTIRLPLICRL